MFRSLFHYTFFIALSALIHYLVIRPPWGPLVPKPLGPSAVGIEIARIAEEAQKIKQEIEKARAEIEEVPQPPPPEPPEPMKPREPPEPPEPARKAEYVENPPPDAEIERLRKEREELAKRLAEEAEKARIAEQAARAAEEARRRAEEDASMRAAAAEAEAARLREREREREAAALASARDERDRAERAREEKEALERQLASERSAREAAEARSKEDQAARQTLEARARDETAEKDAQLKRKLALLDDYTRYSRATEAQAIDPNAVRVPQLRFAGDKSEREFLELMDFYGMELIVYPPTRRFLASVDLATGEMRSIQDPRTYLARFSNRAIEQKGAYWREVADRVGRRFGSRGEDLTVQAVIPNRTASYLAWKELEVCRKAGVDPASVAACYGRYERTAKGTWIVRITELRTFDDRVIPVQDFEGAVPAGPASSTFGARVGAAGPGGRGGLAATRMDEAR